MNRSKAQSNIFIDAMNEEIQRCMAGLKLDKMQSPKFISYTVIDTRIVEINSVLGNLTLSRERDYRTFNDRILVGEGNLTNENYIDENNMWSWNNVNNELPITGGKDDFRRALWLKTDFDYKNAVTNYEAKISAINMQNLTEEEKSIPDFAKASKVELTVPYVKMNYDMTKLESLCKKLSAIFTKYPSIQYSKAYLSLYDAQVTIVTSEGTKVSFPFQLVSIRTIASTQISTGDVVNDHCLWYFNNISKMADEAKFLSETAAMAKNLTALITAKSVTEPYSGPIMFEGEAAAELFVQKFFTQVNGLLTTRKPIAGNAQVAMYNPDAFKENNLEAMLGKKVISRDFTVESLPSLTEFQGESLIGAFNIDGEGVKPAEKLTLIENGVMRNLLSGRVPSNKVKESNGYNRLGLSGGELTNCNAPGVIKVTNNNPATTLDLQKMKQKLIDAAKEEDLSYAYIVRKVESSTSQSWGNSPDFSKTIQVYRVNVADGSEELVSLAEIQGLSTRTFKRILASSSQMQVFNTMTLPVFGSFGSWNFETAGVPSSFIVPQAILFQELDIIKEKQKVVKKLPIVESPLVSAKKLKN